MATVNHCCDMMTYYSTLRCLQHESVYECPDVLIHHDGENTGIIVHDGGSSFIAISCCPWCGETQVNSDEYLDDLIEDIEEI